jgi:hypothetical protein
MWHAPTLILPSRQTIRRPRTRHRVLYAAGGYIIVHGHRRNNDNIGLGTRTLPFSSPRHLLFPPLWKDSFYRSL